MGRRKIKMEMVQDMNSRQVTFSKRRNGLFKKASELATLCNAELGIVVFSPGGKPFSYGKPNLDAVTERFMRECDDSDCSDEEGGGDYRPKLNKISDRLDLLNEEVEASMNSRNTKISCRRCMVGSKVKPIRCRLRLLSCFSPGIRFLLMKISITRPTCWSCFCLFLYQPGNLSV